MQSWLNRVLVRSIFTHNGLKVKDEKCLKALKMTDKGRVYAMNKKNARNQSSSVSRSY